MAMIPLSKTDRAEILRIRHAGNCSGCKMPLIGEKGWGCLSQPLVDPDVIEYSLYCDRCTTILTKAIKAGLKECKSQCRPPARRAGAQRIVGR